MKAWDEDGSSPNNAVVYRIQKGAEDKFILDAVSGFIRVAQGATLNADDDVRSPTMTKVYSLLVIAFDGGLGDDQKKSAVWANITIQDINNKPPVLIDPGTVRLKENTPVRSIIQHIYS